MRNRIPCQRDAGTRLATALPRRPFSACNKGNRRRLHAGNKKDWPVQCDLAPCTLPHHLMLQRRVGRSGPCTQHQQYPYYQIPRGKQTHCNNIVYSHLSVALLRIKKHELMKIGLFTVSLKKNTLNHSFNLYHVHVLHICTHIWKVAQVF